MRDDPLCEFGTSREHMIVGLPSCLATYAPPGADNAAVTVRYRGRIDAGAGERAMIDHPTLGFLMVSPEDVRCPDHSPRNTGAGIASVAA